MYTRCHCAAYVMNADGSGQLNLTRSGSYDSRPDWQPIPASLRPGACANRRRGTGAANTLIGTAAGDLIAGLRGGDVVRGLTGEDCLYGGAGNDRLTGGAGADRFYAGPGVDRRDRVRGCELVRRL